MRGLRLAKNLKFALMHAHPALIGGHVVDPRGKRRAQDLIHAIRHPHLLGWSCWLPCPPTHAFFLGSTERRGC